MGLAVAAVGGSSPRRWLVLVCLLAFPAFAQVPDLGVAKDLANGNVAYVLAVMAVVEAAVIVYLFLALQKAQAKHHAETVETLTNVVTLGVKSAGGLEVLDKAIDHFTQERR